MTVALRVIPCLDVDAGRVVKGVNFENLRDAGDPVELASRYDGEDWIPRERFDRPDLPATVQVGLNAYSDWWTAKSLHGDPLKFDTTVLADGKPDLRLRVDWIRVDERVR